MRENWGTRTGFILATIGSAVGLGNIWRFAYVAGENGGGAFLIVYLVLVVAIGLPLVIAELAIGKRGASDALTAFETLAPGSAWRHVGWIGVAGAVLISSYYGVIAGWALRYFVVSVAGGLWRVEVQEYGAYLADFVSHPFAPFGWQLAMMAAAMIVVAFGIGRGIERLSTLLMPLLALIVVGLAAYGLSLPGAERGVAFLLAPDWGAIANPKVVIAALGQAFFSIGVGTAIFVTYGGYMPREFGVLRSAGIIVAGDTLFAIVAGLAIFPAVASFDIDPSAGPELAFIALPQVFASMTAGRLVAPVFFFLLSAAALTSLIAMLEVPVAVLMPRLGLSRPRAVALAGASILVLGVPSAMTHGWLAGVTIFGLPILDATDAFVSNVVLPLSGIGVAAFVGFHLPRKLAAELCELGHRRLGSALRLVLRILPALLAGLVAYRALAS